MMVPIYRLFRIMRSSGGPLRLQVFEAGNRALEKRALEPGTVAAGTPQCRTITGARAHDGSLSAGVWECTAGTLDITFSFDELVHILEGEVIIHSDEGPRTLRPGDVAFFPTGIKTKWEIPRFVRKVWVHRVHIPTLAERILARLGRFLPKRSTQFAPIPSRRS